MGAWTQSLAVRTGDRNAVRQLVIDWMAAKGFIPDTQPRLFACDGERERGVILFGSSNWTIVLYSQKFDEYERLSLELKKLDRATLFISCFDSDAWGYYLDHGRESLDEFLVQTGHFSQQPETASKAAKLCDALDLNIDRSKLARIMRRRAVFSETVLQQFCDALDITPAGLEFDDIESTTGPFEGVRRVQRFDVEQMIFVSRNAANAIYPLQSFKVRDNSSQPELGFASPEMEQWVAHLRTQAQVMRILFTPLFALASIAGFLFRMGLSFQFIFGRWKRGNNVYGNDSIGVLISELSKINNSTQRREGNYLTNTYYGCRIMLPANATAFERLSPFQVFQLKIEDCVISCQPIQLHHIRPIFAETPNNKIVRDEPFQAKGLSARLLVWKFSAEQNQRLYVQCFVETSTCYYQFLLQKKEPLTESEISTLKSIVATFETVTPTHQQ